MTLTGQSIVGDMPTNRGQQSGTHRDAPFAAINPATGERLDPEYISASAEEVERATSAAERAFPVYGQLSGSEKAGLLREIAKGLEAIRDSLVERANLETALPVPRLQGEVVRTVNQLRMFAEVVEEGSWVMARIDRALPSRTPLPRPDLRSMLRPLGPVAVFGASNFPLAFSVAGGDTASALAAGNPVLVKAHPAHPGTSELVGQAIASSVRAAGLPSGVFALLFDKGTGVGTALVRHPRMKAVGFTGSLAAGRALMDLAAARPDPIPCFAEMSSTNPVFILPGALRQRGEQIAKDLYASVTLGAGQFCTKPGLVFLPHDEADGMLDRLQHFAEGSSPFTMLTQGIAAQFSRTVAERGHSGHVQCRTTSDGPNAGSPFTTHATLFITDAASLEAQPELSQEIFGPSALLVSCADREQTLRAAESLQGHLTATLLGTAEDFDRNRDLVAILERKVGRLIFNGYPTGVEVSHAMVHGGPYPATSDSRSTSVGSQAIVRFARPVCYQNFPEHALPEELRSSNPRGIWRMVDGNMTRESLAE
ncbi:MAG: aldehyde dehydrogenase (NADP(+)) [Acidobacteriaceae bacterium]